jgi:hypothetical protein
MVHAQDPAMRNDVPNSPTRHITYLYMSYIEYGGMSIQNVLMKVVDDIATV